MASEAEIQAAFEAVAALRSQPNAHMTVGIHATVVAALEAAERVRAAEMAKLEKSLTSLIREDRPE